MADVITASRSLSRAAARYRKDYPGSVRALYGTASRAGFSPRRLDNLIGQIAALADDHAASHIFASENTLGRVLSAAARSHLPPEAIEDMSIRICAAMKYQSHHIFYSLPKALEQAYLSPDQIARYFEHVGKGRSHKYCNDALDESFEIFASVQRFGFTPEEAEQLFDLIAANLTLGEFFMATTTLRVVRGEPRGEGETFDQLADRALTAIAQHCRGIFSFYGFPVGRKLVVNILDLLYVRVSADNIAKVLDSYAKRHGTIYLYWDEIQALRRRFGIITP